MAYTLQAIIGKQDTLLEHKLTKAEVVELNLGFALIPFTVSFCEQHSIKDIYYLERYPVRTAEIPDFISNEARRLSSTSPIAYVEAEYHGGDGEQAGIVWENGAKVYGPKVGIDIIDQCLAKLGVQETEKMDEFDVVGLNKYRDTDAWIKKTNV